MTFFCKQVYHGKLFNCKSILATLKISHSVTEGKLATTVNHTMFSSSLTIPATIPVTIRVFIRARTARRQGWQLHHKD